MLSDRYKEFLKMIVYQVYPRSFKDSNGDGIGDIVGIIEKLDYIKSLGANAIWICPCYKSPNVDNGYDISDYRDIMDEFGTLDDMKRLISKAHDMQIKIIMDLVPNHTSSAHKWFVESCKSKDNPYSDYYYWFDEPINNWQSSFGGSAWEYVASRNQYYLHTYAVEQPDLNWNNPNVVKEIQDVIDFWVELGVDGFRCDVIDQISKDFENDKNFFGPRLHEFIHALFGRDNVEHLFTVGECWCDSEDEVLKHSSQERGELTTLFQFDHIHCGRKYKFEPKYDSLKSVRDILIKWQNFTISNDLIYSLFTDNHDQPPFISRMGNDTNFRYEAATCIATMFYTLRGVPFIYQGQEFGTSASYYESIDDFDDIESIQHYPQLFEQFGSETAISMINFGSRDNARHPIAWDDSEYCGFSDSEPWIIKGSRAGEINLKNDIESENSIFRYYKTLLRIRSESPEILYGDFKVLSNSDDDFFVFSREYEGRKIVVCCNFENSSVINLPFKEAKLLLSNYNRTNIDINNYKPYEVAIYLI